MENSRDYDVARRSFLSCLLGGGTALALGGLITPGAAVAAAKPAAKAHAGSWNDDWATMINGKHRQVFDTVTARDDPLIFAVNFLDTGEQAYQLTDKDMTTVVVLRHTAIPMAFTDAIWKKFNLGEMFNITDPRTKAAAVRNIFIKRTPGEMILPDTAVDLLQKRGVIFTCCNVALTFFSGMAAGKMGMDKGAVRQEWINGLLPGVALVPSGVLAVNRSQEKGCTYCYAG